MPRNCGYKLWFATRTHAALKLFEGYSASIDANQRGSNLSDNLFQFYAQLRGRKHGHNITRRVLSVCYHLATSRPAPKPHIALPIPPAAIE